MSIGLSKSDRKRLAKIKEANSQKGGATRIGDCTDIRTRFKHGDRVTTLAADHDVSRETIREHLKGECVCDADGDGLEVRTSRTVAYKSCPYECRFAHRYYDGLTDHIQREHTGEY